MTTRPHCQLPGCNHLLPLPVRAGTRYCSRECLRKSQYRRVKLGRFREVMK